MSGIDPKGLSDEQLASRFAETRDDAYVAEIVRRYQGKLRAGAFAVLGDRGLAEDVTQEVLHHLFMADNRFTVGNLAGWLFRVTRNLSLNLYKQRKRHEALENRFVTEALRNSPAPATHDPRVKDVMEIMAKLPQPQRICLNLFYGSGLTYKEIAQETGFSLKEVKTHLQNGRRHFDELRKKGKPNGG